MKRQDYYPSALPDQVRWLENFAHQLPLQAEALALPAGDLADAVADARWLAYLLGPWRTGSRAWASGLAAQMEHAQTGRGELAPLSLGYSPPPLPAGVVPRPPGALRRVFRLVRWIKHCPGGNEAILLLLGLKTQPDHRQHTATELALSLDRGASGEVVVVRGRRWGHHGLQIESRRRGDKGGDWEEIGILGRRAFRDTRPLLVPGQPEIREYRGRFWDGSTEVSGEWSPVVTVTVSP